MKIVKRISLGILLFIVVILVVGLFLDKNYKVAREISIHKPKQEVFEYIKLLANQNKYSNWSSMDPNMVKTYKGTDGTFGFISAWKSELEDVGAGEQEIKHIQEGERIDYELRFIAPFESTETVYMATETISENQTKVTWGIQGRMEYPTNLLGLMMDFETLIGNDLATGLNNLKNILETEK